MSFRPIGIGSTLDYEIVDSLKTAQAVQHRLQRMIPSASTVKQNDDTEKYLSGRIDIRGSQEWDSQTLTVLPFTSIIALKCDPTCKCQCHVRTQISTPRWTQRVISTFFLSYSINVQAQKRTCNYKECHRSNIKSFSASFILLTAFISRMLSFSILWIDLLSVKPHLNQTHVLDDSDGTWLVIESDNPKALQKAFDTKQARPTDIDSNGGTLLHVS
ncbi:hypothetical protein IQ07DRAFT_321062 [Pyrenochaeta sp. DS3sAY3a]|nr:hypothetical protein IQ07DRAFT_321062 [Pyrenochaeta sp. DS3sAY3a]